MSKDVSQDINTNFDFMQAEWPDIYKSATMAEANLFQDPLPPAFTPAGPS